MGRAALGANRRRRGSPPERLLAADDFQGPSSLSGDGEWLYYTNSVAAPPDIMRLNLRQAGDPEPVGATPAAEFDGRVSPDGRFVAFTALEGDSPGLYVREIVSGSRRLIVSESSAVRGSGEYWGHTRLLRPHPDGVIATRPALTADGQRVVQLREVRDPDANRSNPRAHRGRARLVRRVAGEGADGTVVSAGARIALAVTASPL